VRGYTHFGGGVGSIPRKNICLSNFMSGNIYVNITRREYMSFEFHVGGNIYVNMPRKKY
jgi:hypothetical protein